MSNSEGSGGGVPCVERRVDECCVKSHCTRMYTEAWHVVVHRAKRPRDFALRTTASHALAGSCTHIVLDTRGTLVVRCSPARVGFRLVRLNSALLMSTCAHGNSLKVGSPLFFCKKKAEYAGPKASRRGPLLGAGPNWASCLRLTCFRRASLVPTFGTAGLESGPSAIHTRLRT